VSLINDEAAAAVERHPCPKCDAPSGSPCRTGGGKTAARYHTARFILVPALREELNVAAPPDRAPGRPWSPRPAIDAGMAEVPAGRPIRIGYARCSTARQELASQLAALEKISTRVKVRPELEQALTPCRDIKGAAPGQVVILAVHEMKRLARNAAELMTLAGALQAAGIQLELLSGPLTGIYDPSGMGAMLFAVLAVAAQLDREYIREKTLEGQQAAAAKGNHGGRPKVIDSAAGAAAAGTRRGAGPTGTSAGPAWTAPSRPGEPAQAAARNARSPAAVLATTLRSALTATPSHSAASSASRLTT
jgi:Resolvase, N terminal domain